MNNTHNDIGIINNIIPQIYDKKIALFFGAGISFHSGVPLVNDIVKNILVKCDLSEKEIDLILDSELPFEAIIETIKTETDVDKLLDIFDADLPNSNHSLIAELAKKGWIKNILTTNFDLLIEKAFAKIGLNKNQDYIVFTTEDEFSQIDWQDNKIKLIKIHGSISDKERLGVTMQLVANKSFSVAKNELIQNFFSNKINENILILGYSCSDLFDISPQIESLSQHKSDIFFVDHASHNNSNRCEDISIKSIKNPFKSYTGFRIYADTDKVIEAIWKEFISIPYSFISYPATDLNTNIDNWLFQSIESNTIGIKSHIPARLFYNIGEYIHAIDHCKKGIAIAYKEKRINALCSEMGNMGMSLNALGRYPEAKECLIESVKLAKEIGHSQGEIAQLQALGNVYRNLGDINSARDVLIEAVALSEKYKENYGLGTSLGNLASVYNLTKEFPEAIKCLERGIEISYQEGNKQAEGSQLCSLGIAYYQLGEIEKAKRYINDSINITKSIGDRQGECMALINYSNVFMLSDDFDNALLYANLSLNMAQIIGIRPSEGGSYYNIGTCYFYKGEIQLAIQNLKAALNIYLDVFGADHYHTHSAKKALSLAENVRSHFKLP